MSAKQAWWASVAVVTLLHLTALAVLTVQTQSGPAPFFEQGQTGATAKRWQVRHELRASSATVKPLTPPTTSAPAAIQIEPLPVVIAPDTLPVTSRVSESEPESVAAVEAPDTSLYFPRSALTKAPRPQGVIDIPFPDGLVGHGHYESTLALYIDETGVVRKVEVTGPDLPPPLEEAARLSFMRASFMPGEHQGQPVKSRIVVAVVFDDSAPVLSQQAASDHLPGPV